MSVHLTPASGEPVPLPLASAATRPAAPKETQQIGELRSLLGPLVSPLLQDSQGALDLSKVPSTSFEDFRSFLLTQMRVDGIAFNDSVLGVSLFDSYHAVLADSRHETLLRSLYAAASERASDVSSEDEPGTQDGTTVLNARDGRGRSPSRGEGNATPERPRDGVATQVPVDPEIQAQLLALTADLIGVSGERFASHHLRTPEGRARLANVLLDQKGFSHDLRSDLVKGIALGGRNFGTSREAYRRLNSEISVWNYTNTSVTKDELSRATHITLDILQEVAVQQEESQELHLRYLKRPKDIVRFSGLEKALQRTITDEAIQAKAEYIDWNRDNYDPKIALAVKLDELWLTLIDDTRWQQSGSHKTAKNAAFVLKEVEGLREKLGEINTEAEFLEIAEDIRTLLKGGIGVTGTGTLRSLKDFTASSTVPGMFKDLPEVHRQAYDQLLQYAEELHYAKEMGETITLGNSSPETPPKGPERSDGKAGAVAGGEVRPPTGGTSLAPGPQARDSLLPQVKLAGLPNESRTTHADMAGLPRRDSNTNVDLASLPNKEIPTNTDLAILPKGNRTTNTDLAVLPNTDQSPFVIPAQWPNSSPSTNEDPAKTNEDQQKRFTEAKTQFIHGLKQQKRSLWYQYKQHKALSRGISQAAQLIGQGDIQEIKAGQQALDKIIEQVEQAKDESQLKTQVQALQTQLNADGPLHLAMVAAEMDGTEQLIGLGQTILIIMATRQLGRGMARLSTAIAETQTGQRLANLATQIRQHQLGQSIHRGMQNNVLTWRASKGFALGAWISTAENGIAAATDEVNPEGAHANSWALDALATGAAMGFFTTAASYMGNSIEKNLMQRMMGRYFGSTKAPLRMLGDLYLETGEEIFDATIRSKLEDPDKAIGFDQFREIAMVSGLGGFTKTGMVAEMLRSPKSKPLQVDPAPEASSIRNRKMANMNLKLPPIVTPTYKVDQRGPFGVFLQEKISGVKTYTPLGYVHDRSKSIVNPEAPLAIMISGAGGDQSHFGELPQQLFRAGYQVSNLVIPGYDATDPAEILKVGLSGSQGLADFWFQNLKQATETVMARHPQSPVLFLGHSLGAASVTRILAELEPRQRARVKAMVLAAPAYAFHPFESPSESKNWLMRHVAFPLRVLFSLGPKKARQVNWDPEVADHVYTIPLRPWGSEYAAVLYGEAAARQLEIITDPSDVPPTLILSDEADPTVAPRGAKLASKVLAGRSILKNVKDTDHYPFLTADRQKLFDQIKLFFRGSLVGDSLDPRRTQLGGFRKISDPKKIGSGGSGLLAIGVGLSSLLTPDIANATSEAGRVMASSGGLSGILSALGLASFAGLAMVAHFKRPQRLSVHHIQEQLNNHYFVPDFDGLMDRLYSADWPAKIKFKLLEQIAVHPLFKGSIVSLLPWFGPKSKGKQNFAHAFFRIGKNPEFKGDYNTLIQWLLEFTPDPSLQANMLGEIGANPGFKGDFAALTRLVTQKTVPAHLQATALAEIGSNPHFDQDLDVLLQKIAATEAEPTVMVRALGIVAGNPNFDGNFTALLQNILELDAHPDVRASALAALASNPNCDLDFSGLIETVNASGAHPERMAAALARIAANPHFDGDRDAILRQISKYFPHLFFAVQYLGWIGASPKYSGDLQSLIHQILFEDSVFGAEALSQVLGNPNFNGKWEGPLKSLFGLAPSDLWLHQSLDKIAKLNPNFAGFLELTERFDDQGRAGQIPPHFLAKFFAEQATQNHSPAQSYAAFEAIAGSFDHANPKIRQAMVEMAPTIIDDADYSQEVQALFWVGLKQLRQDPNESVRRAATKAAEHFPELNMPVKNRGPG